MENIVQHSLGLIKKNKLSIEQDDLYCIKNTSVLESGEWNDVHVIENLNKSFIFKKDILSYKKRIYTLSDSFNFFKDIQDESKCISINFMQSILLFGKSDEMEQFRLALTNILNSGANSETGFSNCLKVYNILLYSAPFIFLTTVTEPNSLPLSIFTPFEYASTELYRLSLSIDYTNLPFYMKIQAELENSLPQIFYFKNVYAQSQTILLKLGIYYYRRRQIITVGTLSMARILFTPLLSPFLLANIANNVNTLEMGVPTGISISRDDTFNQLDREIISLFTY